jgi:15-cis-phytoene synthase
LPTPAELVHLYRQAAAETARHSKSFYFATRFFPPDLARAAHAVYWFCRYTDDLADECETLEKGIADIEKWDAQLRAATRTGATEHPVLRVFLDTVNRYAIPLEYAYELIEGMRMDLTIFRYKNFDELRLFCYRVASVVGLMMSWVIGFENPGDRELALPHAIDLGIAMQLTNMLRDVGEDLDRGRIYIPLEEIERFGCSEAQIAMRRRDSAFSSLMQFQVNRARTYYERGNAGIRVLNKRGRFSVKIASDVYREILVQIESSGFDVFDRRAVVPAGQKYLLTARNMAAPIARRAASRAIFWRE